MRGTDALAPLAVPTRTRRDPDRDPDRHLAAAYALAAVPWLADSRRAYHAWAARSAALVLGSASLLRVVGADLGPWAMAGWTLLGICLVFRGLAMGARYGRVVGALAAALALGCTPTWLTHRIAAHEGHPTALAVELEELVEANQGWPWSRW